MVFGAIAGIGAIGGLIGQSSAAKKANKQNQKNFLLNRASALDGLRQNYKLIGMRQMQEDMATSQALMQLEREAQSARGTALTSAGENGVSGASVAALDRLYTRTLMENQQRLLQTREFSRNQLGYQAEGYQQQAYAQIIGAQPNKVPGVNAFDFLAAGLNVASATMQYYK